MRILAGVLFVIASLALAGCERVVVEEDGFGGDVTFCRRIGSKTGKRIAINDSFEIKEGKKYKYVHGLVDLTGIPVGAEHQVHLVWVKPDGKEMYRRFGTVVIEAADEGFRSTVTWLDAEDRHKRKVEDPVESALAEVTLSSRLNVSPEKERAAGEYHLQVYWNRELMLNQAFELQPLSES